MAKLAKPGQQVLLEPKDLSHHFSEVTKNRHPSQIKEYYKFFQIPGMGNLAGGMPHPSLFPFDTLEAQAAKPERWAPTPNYPPSSGAAASRGDGAKEDPVSASSHIAVPKYSAESNPLHKIDLGTALQYGTAEGYPPLLSFVRQFAREVLHPNVPYRGGAEVIMTSGSTDGFSKTLELLTNTWSENTGSDIRDKPGLLCETFIYSNVLSQAEPRGMNIVTVEMDQVGMRSSGPGGLASVLRNWDTTKGKRPHILYTVTMGHNPTGGVLPMERRKEIYAICHEFDVIIVEDDPYWYLQFPSAANHEALSRGLPETTPAPAVKPEKSSGFEFIDSLVPSFLSIDVDGRVVHLDTFSKTVAPGCRLGWITAQPRFIERYGRISETAAQQPSGFVQAMMAQLLLGQQTETIRTFFSLTPTERKTFTGWSMAGWVRWLEGLRGVYERRMVRMCTILDAAKDGIRDVPAGGDSVMVFKSPVMSFSWPRGGMFAWVKVYLARHPCFGKKGPTIPTITGRHLSDAMLSLLTKEEYRVLPAPGAMFAANQKIREERAWSYFRLCFAAETDDRVDDCSRRFGAGVRAFFEIRSVALIEELLKEGGL
ncbi:related to aromatic amino acid aminotransferase I [Cephalotrichum gorgonifer]|uniref:Related to aromatic amino acid aminotransferase I n=1 Tax=Cephalotrichum gorgonifer TaxID=2041049 RepID=A0AAE8MQW5_9PEZI|nr:related to aromatic amino acid aminotransferase I [Cephalotrichum gorgonifer]